MNSHVRDCLVKNYEYLIPSLQLPDLDDRHVLAAAIASGANAIMTADLSDFPKSVVDQYNIAAQHADDFISDLLDLKPSKVVAAAKTCQKRLKNPPKSFDEYLEILLKQGLSVSVSIFQELYDET
jgi:predicted nucleic acid-binding protein